MIDSFLILGILLCCAVTGYVGYSIGYSDGYAKGFEIWKSLMGKRDE